MRPMTEGPVPVKYNCLRKKIEKMVNGNHIWTEMTLVYLRVFRRGNTILEHPSHTWQAEMTTCNVIFTSHQSLA